MVLTYPGANCTTYAPGTVPGICVVFPLIEGGEVECAARAAARGLPMCILEDNALVTCEQERHPQVQKWYIESLY
jgi:hypothetical protein